MSVLLRAITNICENVNALLCVTLFYYFYYKLKEMEDTGNLIKMMIRFVEFSKTILLHRSNKISPNFKYRAAINNIFRF